MSALPPKADIERHEWHVRFVPKADLCTAKTLLFDSAEKQNEYEGQQEREGYEHGNIVCR